jgi:hypothetical protein
MERYKVRGEGKVLQSGVVMRHISEQNNKVIIALHNLWCRVLYTKRIGIIPALRHRHRFQRWTGAQNLLCWCGGVKIK